MIRVVFAALLLAFGLSACNTIAPNRLSALETADLRFTSLDVRVPDSAPIAWTSAEDDYLRARNLSQTDPALLKTPEARGYLRDLAAKRLKTALDRVAAARSGGSRPVRLVVTVSKVDIPSAAQRVLIGGHPVINADIEVYDARTNALLTTYRGAQGSDYAPGGITGVVVDSAMVAGGLRDDLYDRAANDYAKGFARWLSASSS